MEHAALSGKTMGERTTLAVYGADTLVRECLCASLEGSRLFRVVQQTAVSADLLESLRQGEAEILLIDLERDDGAADLVRAVHAELPEAKIVVLGLVEMADEVLGCIESGAGAFVSKAESREELYAALQAVRTGEPFCSPGLASRLFARLGALALERRRSDRVEALKLTAREMEVLQLIADGLSNRSIAERLSLSIYTVKNHVHHILDKLQVKHRREAVQHAYRRHWIKNRRLGGEAAKR